MEKRTELNYTQIIHASRKHNILNYTQFGNTAFEHCISVVRLGDLFVNILNIVVILWE